MYFNVCNCKIIFFCVCVMLLNYVNEINFRSPQPIVTAEVGSMQPPGYRINAAYRLDEYMRYLERRSNSLNRGASQETIERFTFPHKYKRVSYQLYGQLDSSIHSSFSNIERISSLLPRCHRLSKNQTKKEINVPFVFPNSKIQKM